MARSAPDDDSHWDPRGGTLPAAVATEPVTTMRSQPGPRTRAGPPSGSILDAVTSADLPWLRTLAQRLASDDDAEDLLHDTLLHGGGARASAVASPRRWLAGVLRNRRRMAARGQARRRAREHASAVEDAHAADPRPGPEHALHDRQMGDALREVLAQLDPLDRALLVGRYAQDHTAAELARTHALPASTVRSRLHRARTRVRRALDQRYGGDARTWAAVAAPSGLLPGRGAVMAGLGSKGTITAVAAVAAVTVATVATVWLSRPAVTPDPGEPAAQASVADRAETTTPTGRASVVEAKAPPPPEHDHRAATLAKIRAAQASRASAPPAAPEDEDRLPTPEELSQGIDEVFAGQTSAVAQAFRPIVEQLASGLLECLADLPKAASGRVDLELSLIGEPDVGTVVESIDVRSQGDPSQELIDCARESVFTAELPDPNESLLHQLTVTIDLDERELSVGSPLTADNIAQLIERYPDLFADEQAVAELQEKNPESLAALRDAFAADPELAARYPEVAATLGDE